MFIYDTHVHCSPDWYEPIESLLYHMDKNDVSRALLVPFHGNYDSSYIFQCMKNHPDRVAVCIQVDREATDAADQIRRLRDAGAVGVRLLPDEPCPGDEPYALWHVANEVGLSVSCYANLSMCADPFFRQTVESLPDLKIVLEHFGGASRTRRYPQVQMDQLEGLLELAKYPNIYIKVPGFGELCARPDPFKVPPFTEAPAYTKKVYDAFGAKRMMWGSDFPLVPSREGYTNALKYPMNYTPYYTEEDKEWIFGKTALSVWG